MSTERKQPNIRLRRSVNLTEGHGFTSRAWQAIICVWLDWPIDLIYKRRQHNPDTKR
jgi:hypothetical protein